ncbi:DUF1295-domain-containing protein [Hypoxylon trugodes]|uniref:DUF1295-domain-containing protein n=1 Tax=Hypoxylon trugodes TaxID=326681 RepID=UPI00219DB100|nr:DUF1295-domain-containing protein [Hypoxylon trugodes]KAI1384578.1 DUF1295-domain-containing protein [Hypoxylon trugodes]
MALPWVNAFEDCADYSQVVEPYLPQLYELPRKIVDTVSNHDSLVELYKTTNPFISGLGFSIFLGAIFLVAAEVNRNYSQVDRMWSLLPTIYNAHFAAWSHLNNLPSQRVDLILLWSVIWSARLTFNYWRKGGYDIGSEDYRWAIIRSKVHPVLFSLFNATFISFIQSILLFFLAAPTYIVLLASKFEHEATAVDLGFTAVELGLVLSEWFSDQQQWDYQAAKKQYQQTAKIPRGCGFTQEDLDRGFITSGLWAYCRHPNFAAEQTIWILLYQWGCYASKSLYNWTGIGVVVLLMIFQGSTWLTELISAEKYPEYKLYKKQIGAHIPSLTAYKAPSASPNMARTSDVAKRQKTKQR